MTQALALTPGRRRWLMTREILAFTASVLLYPLGMRKKEERTARRPDLRTVVFIHGYLANRSSFLPLASYLEAQGHGSQLSFEYGSGDSLEKIAIDLKRFLKRNVRGGRIDLVCHSMGGLVARIYLQQLGGARRVDRCITIATPHHGTYSAYLLRSRTAQDLRPRSRLLEKLAASAASAASVKFLAISGAEDRIVIPPYSAEFHGPSLSIPEIGHQGLLFSPQVFGAIATHLEAV